MEDKRDLSKEYLEIEKLKADIQKHSDDTALKIQELRDQENYYRSVGFWRNIIIVVIGLMAATATITAAILKN